MKVLTPLKFGLIAGIAAITLQVLVWLISPANVSSNIWMFFVYLPILFCMIFGGITYRKENDGQISFGNSLVGVFIVALSGMVLVNVFTYEILMKVIDPNLFETIIENARYDITMAGEKKGLSDETINESLNTLEIITPHLLRNITWSISGFFTILLSLLVALFVRRPDKQPQIKPEA